MAKFLTNASVIFFAGEITQVLYAIPWVRCASGNVSTIFAFGFVSRGHFIFVASYFQILQGALACSARVFYWILGLSSFFHYKFFNHKLFFLFHSCLMLTLCYWLCFVAVSAPIAQVLHQFYSSTPSSSSPYSCPPSVPSTPCYAFRITTSTPCQTVEPAASLSGG